jgi:hypothetical protein
MRASTRKGNTQVKIENPTAETDFLGATSDKEGSSYLQRRVPLV